MKNIDKKHEKLREYIKNWKSNKNQKPCNEQLFYDEFLKLIKSDIYYRDVSFDGDGSYFGKQITLSPDSFFCGTDPDINFEIAYSYNKISIYNANHNGFWYPEYICMDKNDNRFNSLQIELDKFLHNVFGLICD